MSVIEKIQKLFKTRSAQPEDSMDMSSLGVPADSMAAGVTDDMAMSTAAVRPLGNSSASSDEDGFAPSRLVVNRRRAPRRVSGT